MVSGKNTLQEDLVSDDSLLIASQLQLIWWRFIRHRLAVIASCVILILYLVALFPEFLSVHNPNNKERNRVFMPPQRIHFFEGKRPALPYVYDIKMSRNVETLGLEYTPDPNKKFKINYFTKGYEYKILGLLPFDRHLFGVEGNAEASKALYIFGTDRLGRDLYSRLMHGTRLSMSIGLIGVLVSLFLGVLLGGISGYRGGIWDSLIQRLIEFLRSIPTIPLWLGLSAAVPKDWSVIQIYFAITLIISFLGWTTLAREVRGRFLSMRQEDFVVAARLYGTHELRIIFRHMVPSFMSHIIATTTLAVPAIIIAETSLSFLGLGLRPPAISWGTLLFEAQNLNAVANAPWLMIPGPTVLIAVLAFNFAGDGIRDATDPYSNN